MGAAILKRKSLHRVRETSGSMEGHVEIDEAVLCKFAKGLAGNESKTRNRTIKKFKNWMSRKAQATQDVFTESDFLKIWKGLHYCMWMADKPLVQEELADRICSLLDCFSHDADASLLFAHAFFETEAREWNGIDRLRLDKFMMLIRKFLKRTLLFVQSRNWEENVVQGLAEMLGRHVVSATRDTVPCGLVLHVADVFVEELEKVADDHLLPDRLQMLLEPYCVFLTKEKNQETLDRVAKRVFLRLLDFSAPQNENDKSPTGSDDDVIDVDYGMLSDRLTDLASSTECHAKNRKLVYTLVKAFRDMSQGILPPEEQLSDSDEEWGERARHRLDMKLAVDRLQSFEAKLSAKEKKKGKKRKKKQREAENGLKNGEIENESEEPPAKKRKSPEKKQKESEQGSMHLANNSPKQKGPKSPSSEGGAELRLLQNKDASPKSSSKSPDRKPHQVKTSVLDSNNSANSSSDASPKKGRKTHEEHLERQSPKSSQEAAELSPKKKNKKTSSPVKRVENFDDGSDNSTEPVIEKADVVVPARRGKLKDLVSQPVGKPNVKVIDEDDDSGDDDQLASQAKQMAQAMMKILNSEKGDSDDKEENVFVGGFVDSDDETGKSAKKQKKKKSKDKRKSLPANLPSQSVSDGAVNNQSGDSATTEKQNAKKAKKLKRKSTGSVGVSPTTSPGQVKENGLEEGEYEILIPNKKYKGKYKEAFQNEVEKSLQRDDDVMLNMSGTETVQTGPGRLETQGTPFATFTTSQTPSAFVKRALSKVSPSDKSGKKKKRKSLEKMTTPSGNGRRVSFGLDKNQEFKHGRLQPSPASAAFDPKLTPNQGILKSSPQLHTGSFLGSSPAAGAPSSLQKQVLQKKRPRAEDFF